MPRLNERGRERVASRCETAVFDVTANGLDIE